VKQAQMDSRLMHSGILLARWHQVGNKKELWHDIL